MFGWLRRNKLRRHNKRWTTAENDRLFFYRGESRSWRQIARKLGRTRAAVKHKYYKENRR